MANTPSKRITPSTALNRFPPGIPYIVGNEGAERFSYYGMRAILYAYMTTLYLNFLDPSTVSEAVRLEAETRATEITHLFMAGVYAFPMIGAILADRLLGKYRVIFWVSLIYCAGHGVLALAGDTIEGMYVGLALIAVGSGGIKPCVSANVGDQFTAENSHLVSKIYQIFYFIINFGSFFSTLITPWLYRSYGPEVAFGVPGILMGVATLVFWLGRHKFTKVPPKPGGVLGVYDLLVGVLLFTPLVVFLFVESASLAVQLGVSAVALLLALAIFSVRERIEPSNGFLSVLYCAARNQHRRRPGMGFFDVVRAERGDEAAEGPVAVLKIVLVFSMVSVFWALFDQHATTWIKQAGMMDLAFRVPHWVWQWFVVPAVVVLSIYGGAWLMLYVSNRPVPRGVTRTVLGLVGLWGLGAVAVQFADPRWQELVLDKSQISSLNPLFVMIIIPLLNGAVYAPLERRGITIKPLQKMTVGMFLASLAFVSVALLQSRIEDMAGSGAQLSVAWQVIPYLIMTAAEVLVSTTGLEFAYTQAPRAMKSTIMGFWLLCVTVGNKLVAVMSPLQQLSLSTFFWTFAALMGFAALVFSGLAYFYKGKTYLQEAPEKAR